LALKNRSLINSWGIFLCQKSIFELPSVYNGSALNYFFSCGIK
jgi:hypothetical protein